MGLFKKRRKIVKKPQSHRNEYLLTDKVSFNVMEAFRNFKASLSVSMSKKKEGEGTAIMVTSSCPEDGKTTVAVNLALMYAFSDVKVVLVDADVRKGRVARFFKRKSAPGLADYLSGQATLDEITHKDHENKNFSFITCGTHSPRPYELLESDEMKKLIEELKKLYDFVIIDTPPLLVVSDALAIATETDGTVVVSRHQTSYLGDIAKTLEKLQFAKANVLGVVVNDYNVEEKAYYSHNYYHYNYYSYQYGDSPDEIASQDAQVAQEKQTSEEQAESTKQPAPTDQE